MKTTLAPELFFSSVIHGIVIYFFLTLPISSIGSMSFDSISVTLVSNKPVKSISSVAITKAKAKKKNIKNREPKILSPIKNQKTMARSYSENKKLRKPMSLIKKPKVKVAEKTIRTTALKPKTEKTVPKSHFEQKAKPVSHPSVPKEKFKKIKDVKRVAAISSRSPEVGKTDTGLVADVVKDKKLKQVKRPEELKNTIPPKEDHAVKPPQPVQKRVNTKVSHTEGDAAISESPELPGENKITQISENNDQNLKEAKSDEKQLPQQEEAHTALDKLGKKIEKENAEASMTTSKNSLSSLKMKENAERLAKLNSETINRHIDAHKEINKKSTESKVSSIINQEKSSAKPEAGEHETVTFKTTRPSQTNLSKETAIDKSSYTEQEKPITATNSPPEKVGDEEPHPSQQVKEAQHAGISLVSESTPKERITVNTKADQKRSETKLKKPVEKLPQTIANKHILSQSKKIQGPPAEQSELVIKKHKDVPLAPEKLIISKLVNGDNSENNILLSEEKEIKGANSKQNRSIDKSSSIKEGQQHEEAKSFSIAKIRKLPLTFAPTLSDIKLPEREVAMALMDKESPDQPKRVTSLPAPPPPVIFGEKLIFKGWDETFPVVKMSEILQESETQVSAPDKSEKERAIDRPAISQTDVQNETPKETSIIKTDNSPDQTTEKSLSETAEMKRDDLSTSVQPDTTINEEITDTKSPETNEVLAQKANDISANDTATSYVGITEVFDSMFAVMNDLIVESQKNDVSTNDAQKENMTTQERAGPEDESISSPEAQVPDEPMAKKDALSKLQPDIDVADMNTTIADEKQPSDLAIQKLEKEESLSPQERTEPKEESISSPEAQVPDETIAKNNVLSKTQSDIAVVDTNTTIADETQPSDLAIQKLEKEESLLPPEKAESKEEAVSSPETEVTSGQVVKKEALPTQGHISNIAGENMSNVDEIQTPETPKENSIVAEILTPELNRTPSRREYQLRVDTKVTLARNETKKQEKIVKDRGLVLPLDILNDIEAEVYLPGIDNGIAFALERRPHPMENGSPLAKGKPVGFQITDRYGEPGNERVMIYVERAEKGVYTFKIKNNSDRTLKLTVKFRLYRGRDAEKRHDLQGLALKAHDEVNVKFLMPEAVFWNEKEYFTGEIENSGYITKFNADTGLVWKEKK